MGILKTSDHVQIKIKMQNSSQEWGLKDIEVLSTFKIKNWNSDQFVSKTSDHVQIKIKMPNPSQEPPAFSKAQNEDLKDIDVLCTFKIKIETQNLEQRCITDQWPYPNQDKDVKSQSGTSSILQSPKSGLQGHACLKSGERE